MAPTILITGKDGQVGTALVPALRDLGRVVAMGRPDCDLTNPASLRDAFRAVRPDIVINAAAYTAVDKAESERELAQTVNATAPGILAELSKETGAALIHYSTDYVFDGERVGFYREDDPTNPLSVYGASKRDGEIAIRDALVQHVILRTSWVFSAHGANFLKTMLRLARERDALRVVSDQIGAPTSAGTIASVTAELVRSIAADRVSSPYGTYHLAAQGETSWHGFAAFLISQARKTGFPIRVSDDAILPIATSEYPTPARRPGNSRLDTGKLRANFGIGLPPWQTGVRDVLEELART